MKNVSRRNFIRTTSLLAATTPSVYAAEIGSSKTPTPSPVPQPTTGSTQLSWLDGNVPQIQSGTAFGVPWPMGQQAADTTFTLRTPQGKAVPLSLIHI